MVPAHGGCSPAIARSRLDFPLPDSPTTATVSPRAMVRDSSAIARVREQVASSLVVQAAVGLVVIPERVHCASSDLHGEQDGEPAQPDGVEGEQGRWPADPWPRHAAGFVSRC